MHQRLRVLADYLLSRKDSSEVNPRDIDPKVLPHLFILNIERGTDGKRNALRVRFAGTALDTAFQRKLVNSRLEEFAHGPRATDVLAGFHACADDGRALWMRQVVHIKDRPPRFVEGVTVRLAPDRLYGGLIVGFGDLARAEETGFESLALN
jgi:hypothetical protein